MNKTKEPYVTQKAFSGLVDFFSRAVVEHKASESWKKKTEKRNGLMTKMLLYVLKCSQLKFIKLTKFLFCNEAKLVESKHIINLATSQLPTVSNTITQDIRLKRKNTTKHIAKVFEFLSNQFGKLN